MAPKLPPVNATLTKVQAPGLSDGWEDEETLGAVRFEGGGPAYASEQVIVETSNGAVDQLKVSRIVIPSSVPIDSGDFLTFTKDGTVDTRRVRNIEERSDFGFTRIYFWDD